MMSDPLTHGNPIVGWLNELPLYNHKSEPITQKKRNDFNIKLNNISTK